MRLRRCALAASLMLAAASVSVSQEMPLSGVFGLDLVYATNGSGTSQLYAISPTSPTAIPLASVASVPSRWAHRRRTLGALETEILYLPPLVMMTPMGDAVGTGAIHLIDGRLGLPVTSALIPTGNPAGYDLVADESRQFVFAVEDDGVGTTLRGFSYATPGTLIPLSPPTLSLPGRPSSYVNRIGIDRIAGLLYVPTESGVQIVTLASSVPQIALGAFLSTTDTAPATNPISFTQLGVTTWIVGTSSFSGLGDPTEAGWLAWNSGGATGFGKFGVIPGRSPPRNWVPAAGAEELAVVSNDTDSYAYFLLRDPSPTSLFIRASTVGVIRFLGAAAPDFADIPCPDPMGEPFAIPTVSGTRVAIESSEGPPWFDFPPGGAEKISILYSPLDPLGSASAYGVLGVAGPLGGRISTKGMDRPLWTRDGSRVISFTSHFPGAPNPAVPGLEVLNVPPDVRVDEYTTPHLVVENATFPNQAIMMPGQFLPRDLAAASFLDGFSFAGNVFHDGMASAMTLPFGEIGQKQEQSPVFVQSPAIPNFPAIFPPSFEDATGSLTPIPGEFGARRTSFNLVPGWGLSGLVMSFAYQNALFIQPAGVNFLAAIGLGTSLRPFPIALPAGFVTTTEILSL